MGFDIPVDPLNNAASSSQVWGNGGNESLFTYVYYSNLGPSDTTNWGCPAYQSYVLYYRLEGQDRDPEKDIGLDCGTGSVHKISTISGYEDTPYHTVGRYVE